MRDEQCADIHRRWHCNRAYDGPFIDETVDDAESKLKRRQRIFVAESA